MIIQERLLHKRNQAYLKIYTQYSTAVLWWVDLKLLKVQKKHYNWNYFVTLSKLLNVSLLVYIKTLTQDKAKSVISSGL